MSRMMSRMPGVKRGGFLQRPRPGFRMDEFLLKLSIRQVSEHLDEPLVNTVNYRQRDIDRQLAVRKFGPAIFVVRLDRRRRIFG